jgi:hypothetical protein
MLGKRKHFRIKGSFEVSFGVQGQPEIRNGTISNISMNGLEMFSREDFPEPATGSLFFIEPVIIDDIVPLQSKQAKMMWVKSITKEDGKYFQFGLEFIKDEKNEKSNDAPNAIDMKNVIKKNPSNPNKSAGSGSSLLEDLEDLKK